MDLEFERGFSLIELVVTLAVASILAAIALPSWNKLLPSYQLDSSARQVQSELHNIKMRAATENVGLQLVYSNGAADYTIQRANAYVIYKGKLFEWRWPVSLVVAARSIAG